MSASIPVFLQHLPKACEQMCAGFHFEEGGCWGMALALETALKQQGQPCTIWVRPMDFVHAMMDIDGQLIDYSGLCTQQGRENLEQAGSRQAVLEWADNFGITQEEVENDEQFATKVIALAQEIAAKESEAIEGGAPGEAALSACADDVGLSASFTF
jgi:hypothetical protein